MKEQINFDKISQVSKGQLVLSTLKELKLFTISFGRYSTSGKKMQKLHCQVHSDQRITQGALIRSARTYFHI